MQPQGRPGRETPGGRGGTFPHTERAFKLECGHCGAIRIDSQIGLEPNFRDYVAAMVEVFREVKRVLRKDGTCWLNLGDSYAGSWGNQGRKEDRGTQRPINGGMLTPVLDGRYPGKQSNTGKIPEGSGLKPKDLCGIPWRVAFALQEDGWYLRQDIIWSKPNPMPESVTDRCTKSHEYIFLLAKSERYYYDAEAIKEAETSRPQNWTKRVFGKSGGQHRNENPERFVPMDHEEVGLSGRNRRSVWEVTTQPFSEAHFATFPPALIEPCIKAGTSEKGCCGTCGTPWVRQVERTAMVIDRSKRTHDLGHTRSSGTMLEPATSITLRWSPSCKCVEWVCPVECVVLDSPHENGKANTAHNVSDVQSDVSPMEKEQQVLFSEVLRDTAKFAPGNNLPAMQEGDSADEQSADILQQVLFNEVDGDPQSGLQGREDREQPRLRLDLESGPQGSAEVRLHDGTSTCDGEETPTSIAADRGCSPSQRDQNGQQVNKSGIVAKTRSRQTSKSNIHGNVPGVHARLSAERQCPRCGRGLVARTPSTVPATVLDCFAGAGTTGLVADRLQRNAILIELNPAYSAMSERRIVGDAPLFADVSRETWAQMWAKPFDFSQEPKP